MPIEFNCPSCQAKIRTPDNSAGRSARCPKCSTVLTVPGASSASAVSSGSSAPPGFSSPPAVNPLGAPSGNPLGALPGNPLGTPPSGSIPNPFGDKPHASFGSSPNPYAPPSAAASQGYFQPMQPVRGSREQVRPWLLGPAIGITVVSAIGLVFMSMVVLGMAVDPDAIFNEAPQDPAERAGFYGFFVVYFIGGLLTRLLQIIGAISLFRVRGYGLAMTAAICAMLPCDVYCCIGSLPFGIWALIMLNKPEVKSAFQLP
jgi:predicted Zn finger-like uncharacterized protein